MAYPEERSIFDDLFLSERKSRGRKFLLATAAGVGVAAVLVVGALAAGGGGAGPSRTSIETQGLQPSTAGLGLTSGNDTGQSNMSGVLIATMTPAPASQAEMATAAVTATPSSTVTASTAQSRSISTATAATAAPSITATEAPAGASPSDGSDATRLEAGTPVGRESAALLTAAPTSTPVTARLIQEGTSTPSATPAPTQTPAPTSTPTPMPTVLPTRRPSSSATVGDLEQEMLEYHNRERTARGIPALSLDATARQVARARSQDMADNNYFSHDPPDGVKYYDLLKKAGASFSRSAENIAWNSGYSLARSAEVAMYGEDGNGGLMGSDGHRENILSRSYTRIGIGVVKTGNEYYYTMLFLGP